MTLGAVLAGGRSSRFGRDKALALLAGETLLDRAVKFLGERCDRVVVVGRTVAPAPTLPDWPRPGGGPLGGLAAALIHALDHGYTTVLTVGVDSVELPGDLLAALSPAPSFVHGQPVVGHWPAGATDAIEAILMADGKHSMKSFAKAIDARPVHLPTGTANINTPADLAAVEQRHGL